jgi:hypothetical protein
MEFTGIDAINALIQMSDPKDVHFNRMLNNIRTGFLNRAAARAGALYQRSAATGEVPQDMQDERGLIGSALQGLGVLGEPGRRPLTNIETMATYGGKRAYDDEQRGIKSQRLAEAGALSNIYAENPYAAQALASEYGLDQGVFPEAPPSGSRRWGVMELDKNRDEQLSLSRDQLEAQKAYWDRMAGAAETRAGAVGKGTSAKLFLKGLEARDKEQIRKVAILEREALTYVEQLRGLVKGSKEYREIALNLRRIQAEIQDAHDMYGNKLGLDADDFQALVDAAGEPGPSSTNEAVIGEAEGRYGGGVFEGLGRGLRFLQSGYAGPLGKTPVRRGPVGPQFGYDELPSLMDQKR